MSTHSSSAARVAANQENATHSTGPNTEAGKAKSSRNAVTHALTGRTVVLATEDVELYERHLAAYKHKWQPATEDENVLVQSIADTDWRLSRIPQLILALQAKAREEMTNEHKDLAPEARGLRLELEGMLKYEKTLRNLQLQEGRLHRRREKDIIALRTAIQERQARREQELTEAAQLYAYAQQYGETFIPADHGFDFSIAQIESHRKRLNALALSKQPTGALQIAPAAA